MSLLKRYVFAVGRRLPEKSRSDIERELESLIMDALEAKVGPDRQASEDDVVAVLKEFGSPDQAAARYAPKPQYLIGPHWYPIYRLVLAITLVAVAIGLSISLIVGAVQEQDAYFVNGFKTLLSSLFTGVLAAFGNVTLVFAILERALPNAGEARTAEQWDPRKLAPISDHKAWGSPAKIAVNIGFTVLFALLFNLYPDRIGIYLGPNASFIPITSAAAIRTYLPLWDAVWALTLAHYVILLIRRGWSFGNKIFDLVVSVANAAVLAIMATGVSLIDQQALLANSGMNIADLGKWADMGLRMSFGIAAAVLLIVTAVKAFRLLVSERQ